MLRIFVAAIQTVWRIFRGREQENRMLQKHADPGTNAAFDGIFEHCVQPLLIVEPVSDRILDANPSACRLLGYDRTLLRSVRFSALHPGQLPALIVFTEAVLAKGTFWTRGLTARDAAGNELPVEYSASVLPGDEGRLVLLTITDLKERQRRDADTEADLYIRGGVSEWQRIERVFRDLERENQLLLRAAGDGIFGVNTEGKTTFINPAGERMLGWKAEDLIGRDMHSVVHHTHPDGTHYHREDCPIYAAFHDGAVHKIDNEVLWRKDGSSFWVEYTSTPVRDRGQLVGAVMIFRDITQRREADEKLRVALEEVGQLRNRLELENAYLQEEIRVEGNRHGIAGRSAPIEHARRQIELVAPTDATVLITGESGTGKELIARAIHETSNRSRRPLIRVNCAAVPRELFESEFFGHAKGTLAGAVRDRVGRFELADGGTLFLDEVGEIPLELQGKLLRVLEEGIFERVGEARTRKADVRVIAATNRDLKDEVREGRFREDLYFRLNVFPIECVPLRDRREDIPLLAAHFLRLAERKMNNEELRLSIADVRRLSHYDWPGNVRELQNVIERGAILARNGQARIDVPDRASARPGRQRQATAAHPGQLMTEEDRRERDRANILAALEASGGKVFGQGGAAELLEVKPTTLLSRIKSLGLRVPQSKREEKKRGTALLS
jgi:formate hydrogenlyase transcriptional activator